MIHESWYWKQPLLETAKRLRALKARPAEDSFDDELGAEIERDIFIGFYSVRKLIEAVGKVTDATRNSKWPILSYNNRKPVSWINGDKLDELYDFEGAHAETRDLLFVCGRIIHSFVFMPYIGEAGCLAGILFTSDTDKHNKLYSMKIDDVISIFERVGNDYPTNIEYHIDPDSGEGMTTTS